jgi:hypothetical protein
LPWSFVPVANYPIRSKSQTSILWHNNTKHFFLSRRLAVTKKFGTCTILIEYEKSVKWLFFENNHFTKKIWCASWARVNLPHNSNKKCIKIVLQRNLLKNTQGLSFFSRNLYRRYSWDVKYQNSECSFLFLDPKIVT